MSQASRSQIAAILILLGGTLVCLAPGGIFWYGRTVYVTSSRQDSTTSAYSTNPGIASGPKIGAALIAVGATIAILGWLNHGVRGEVQ